MNFHPDVLAAHTQFGGDLESMQALYDRPDHLADIASLKEQLEALAKERDNAIAMLETQAKLHRRAEAERDRLEVEREQDAERWLADKSALDACREVLRKAKAFHDRDSGCNGFTADYEILRYEIDAALASEEKP